MAEKNRIHTKWHRGIKVSILASAAFLALSYLLTETLSLTKPVMAAAPEVVLEKIREAAHKEGGLVWYESSPEGQFTKVAAAFNKRYPKI